MTKQELVKFLIELDSEYPYQDYGHGGFKNETTFVVCGEPIPVSRITKDELEQMVRSSI